MYEMRPDLFSFICMISAYSVHLCAYEVTARNDRLGPAIRVAT